MTPEIQAIIDLLLEAEQLPKKQSVVLHFISTRIKPSIIKADASLRSIKDEELKRALSDVETRLARAETLLRNAEDEADIKEGFDRFGLGILAFVAAKKRLGELEAVESQ
jgi:hypothetical protein